MTKITTCTLLERCGGEIFIRFSAAEGDTSERPTRVGESNNKSNSARVKERHKDLQVQVGGNEGAYS